MADQLATVSKTRLGQKLGELSPADLGNVEQAIKTQLGFSRSEKGRFPPGGRRRGS